MPTPLVAFPWGSASRMSVRRSAIASEAAKLTAVVVFPTPPFWLAIAIMWAMEALTCKCLLLDDLMRYLLGEIAGAAMPGAQGQPNIGWKLRYANGLLGFT